MLSEEETEVILSYHQAAYLFFGAGALRGSLSNQTSRGNCSAF